MGRLRRIRHALHRTEASALPSSPYSRWQYILLQLFEPAKLFQQEDSIQPSPSEPHTRRRTDLSYDHNGRKMPSQVRMLVAEFEGGRLPPKLHIAGEARVLNRLKAADCWFDSMRRLVAKTRL